MSSSQTQITLPGGRWVQLADLGEVKDSSSEQRTITKMNGRQVVTFYVQRARARPRSTPMTRHGRAEEAREGNPEGPLLGDLQHVDYTKSQYRSAMEGLIEGAVLAVLVVFLFLRDMRATVISALPSRCRRFPLSGS
jgi:multidrug efflux pump subunit AcrB